jgi:hypothetical protein
MGQFYADDQVALSFSTTAASDGRYYTNGFVACGSPSWSFTIVNLPSSADAFGLRVECNNSRHNVPGNQGIINPLINSLMSTNYNPHSISAMKDANFDNNWVPYKPESEFYITSFTAGSKAVCGSDTGVFPIQGAVRYLRLSMTAQPTTATTAFFFDSVNILRG